MKGLRGSVEGSSGEVARRRLPVSARKTEHLDVLGTERSSSRCSFGRRLPSGLILLELWMGFWAAGCIRTNSIALGRKTELERQLMGRLEPFSNEELLAASVRAESSAARGPLLETEARAIAARRRQIFNRDDVAALQQAGCVGEGRDGVVEARPCPRSQVVAALLSSRPRLVREENEDRGAIIEWAIDSDPTLTPGDLPQVWAIYHLLAVERAPRGAPVEQEDGQWRPKP